ncbi:MAG TPA: BPL-N domain-containing protein, partial [Verrucomicrobiae bacterium]|nr:BPL-N domain-containing protein [Verrucomicrobiae bacterium]
MRECGLLLLCLRVTKVTGAFCLAIVLSPFLPSRAATVPSRQPIRVALYTGPGTGGPGPADLMKQFDAPATGCSIARISPGQICAGALTNFDVVIFAGGSGSRESKAMGEEGLARVKEFVGNGGGYIGVCAGAYLALDNFPWSLHLINAKTLSPKWHRGHAVLKVELTAAGKSILGGATNLDVLYHQGPVVGPANDDDLPPYEPLAYFRSEVASNNTPAGIMIGSPAIFAGQFKQGRVVCVSPHPEQTPGLEYIVLDAVKWAASAGEITPKGHQLLGVLDGMHVDKLWLPGRRVDWRSGASHGTRYTNGTSHTHCSAFAAAAAERLGIYLLRPPEHSTVLLANAQQDWLCSRGTNHGWRRIDSAIEAQRLANRGELVVVTYKSPKPARPGHIAIVRPSHWDKTKILSEG